MTPPTFRIGDLVEITGPSAVGARVRIGEKFTISEILKRADSEAYSDADHSWYPTSSLRLVEELKIGDWVEVIGPALGGSENERGKIFKITQDTTMCTGLSAAGMAAYPRESLRKLTPEEMQPIKVIPTAEGNAKRLDAHREEIDAVNERLSAIEKRQSAMCSYNIETEQRLQKLEAFHMGIAKLVVLCPNGKPIGVNERLSAIERRQGVQQNRMDVIEKRIDFIEAFQKHAAYTTYTYNPDDSEHGTITVNCSCGRKYELEATPRACYSETKLWI